VSPVWILALVALATVASVSAPLLTYGTTLALFGGAHVATELRFVDRRFGPRLGSGLRWGLVGLLAVVVLLRLGKALSWWKGELPLRLELIVVLLLGALVLPVLLRFGGGRAALAVGLLGLLALGLAAAPAATILCLAVLHNWTPLGFVAEASPAGSRRRNLGLALLAFLGLPALVATGLPAALLASLGAGWPELRLFDSGPLSRNLGVYLPAAWHEAPWALDLFRAAVLAQCLHYTWVIGVLPRLPSPAGASGPWLGLAEVNGRVFALAVAALSLVGLFGWSQDFHGSRSWYGLVAAVHAWIEVPILLLALVPATQVPVNGALSGRAAGRSPARLQS